MDRSKKYSWSIRIAFFCWNNHLCLFESITGTSIDENDIHSFLNKGKEEDLFKLFRYFMRDGFDH